MTPDEELRRAGEATQMLQSPVFVMARKDLEERIAMARRSVPIRDTEMHTRLILMEQLAENFFAYFDQLAQTGKLAQLRLDEEAKRRSMLERGVAMFRTGGRNVI